MERKFTFTNSEVATLLTVIYIELEQMNNAVPENEKQEAAYKDYVDGLESIQRKLLRRDEIEKERASK